jgi:hypothetical protein
MRQVYEVHFRVSRVYEWGSRRGVECGMVEFTGEYGNTWLFRTLGLRYPWIFGFYRHQVCVFITAVPITCDP